MGSGKSTLGKALSEASHRPWIDTDLWIEHCTGLTVSDLVAKEGWDRFRSLEVSFIREFSFQGPSILSTGGGFPLQRANATWLKSNAHTFYLEVDSQTLFQRLSAGKTFRPLINDKDDAALQVYIEQMVQEREAVYKQADFILDGTLPLDRLLQEVLRLI